jgi:hypothetical protein
MRKTLQMIIEFGKDFTSFCWVVESNWITYRVVKIANNPKPITYETEDMQWLW